MSREIERAAERAERMVKEESSRIREELRSLSGILRRASVMRMYRQVVILNALSRDGKDEAPALVVSVHAPSEELASDVVDTVSEKIKDAMRGAEGPNRLDTWHANFGADGSLMDWYRDDGAGAGAKEDEDD